VAISSAELAEAYGLPQQTLAKVLQHLAEAGLLTAHHGVRGGYTLRLDPYSISLLDVIRASGNSVPSPPRLDSRSLTIVDHSIKKLLNRMTIVDILEHNKDASVHRENETSRFLAHIPCQT